MRVVHLCSGKKSAQVVCKDAEINSGFGAFYLPFHFLPLCRRIARTHTACERLSRIHFGRRLNVFVYKIIFLDVQCTAVQRASRNHFILRFIQTDFVYRMHTLTHTHWSLVSGYWVLPVGAHSNQQQSEKKKREIYFRWSFEVHYHHHHMPHNGKEYTLFQSHLTYTYFHCIFL